MSQVWTRSPDADAPLDMCGCPKMAGEFGRHGYHVRLFGEGDAVAWADRAVEGDRHAPAWEHARLEALKLYKGTQIALEPCPRYMEAILRNRTATNAAQRLERQGVRERF